MRVKSIKLAVLIMHTVLVSAIVHAQAYRFVYLQTENNQPFYAKLGKHTFNSSPSGYMIIPKLADSAYHCVIGFPGEKTVSYQFGIKAGTANAGFLLKKAANNEWVMYNLQSLQPVPVQQIKIQVPEDTIVFIENEFARVLASVVNDPSIAQVSVKKKMENSAEHVAVSAKAKDDLIISTGNISGKDSVRNGGVNMSPEITKLKQEQLDGGTQITYVDREKAGSDTIKLFLPANPPAVTQAKETGIPDTTSGKPGALIMTGKMPAAAEAIENNPVVSKSETPGNNGMINSDCKKIATEKEFAALRKNMASKADENEMLKLANRQFIKTCFTTAHIRSLGGLFVDEQNRYRFFVLAFPFAADTHNFGALEDQLTDSYYKNRFKAMLVK